MDHVLKLLANAHVTPSNISLTLFLAFLAYRAVSLLDAYFVSPLRHIPAYHLSMISRLWPLSIVATGGVYRFIYKAHDKCGSIVRILPHLLSVADPELAQRMLRIDDLPKPRQYDFLKDAVFYEDNLLVARDAAWHKNARRMVSPAFSIKSMASLEPFMRNVWSTFEAKVGGMTKNADGSATVDLAHYFHVIAIDVIAETAFGKPMHMVKEGHHPYHAAIQSMLLFGMIRVAAPFIPMLPSHAHHLSVMDRFLNSVVKDRKELVSRGSRREDLLQKLVDGVDKDTGERLDEKGLETNAKLFMAAGSETTANSMHWILYQLLLHPTMLTKLRNTLDAAFPEGHNSPLPYSELRTLPYLTAVIKEGLRLNPVVGQVGRMVAEDTWVDANDEEGRVRRFMIPAGTETAISVYTLHTHPKIWIRGGEFFPDRWLQSAAAGADDDIDADAGKAVERDEKDGEAAPGWGRPALVNKDAFLPFSIGSRDCIGRGFAWEEMHIMLGHLIRRYDLEPAFDVTKPIVGRDYITIQNREAGGLPVKLRRRTA